MKLCFAKDAKGADQLVKFLTEKAQECTTANGCFLSIQEDANPVFDLMTESGEVQFSWWHRWTPCFLTARALEKFGVDFNLYFDEPGFSVHGFFSFTGGTLKRNDLSVEGVLKLQEGGDVNYSEHVGSSMII